MLNQIRKLARGVLGGVAVVFLLAAAPAYAQAPVKGGTLNVGFPSDTKTLDPIFSVQFTERQVLYLIYNTLVKLGPDFSVNPELATKWDVMDGGKRVILHLRDGVKFHDGTEFDANAVKWNLDRRLDESVGSPQRKQLASVIDKVEVVDKLTVGISLVQPFPALLGMLGQREGFMVSPTASEKHGENFGSNPVGTGPFVFKEWVRGSHIIVEKNANYWEEGLPHLDAVHFKDTSNSIVGLQRLKTGELDYVGQLSPNDVRPIEGDSNIELHRASVGRWYSLQWHLYEPPFDNVNLRRAIAHAIDRERIVQITMAGKADIANGPTPPGLWWYDKSIQSYEYDLEKSKEYQEKAGYKPGTELTLYASTASIYKQISQLVQEQLTEAGFTVKIEPVSSKEWYGRVVKRLVNFTPTRWTQRPDPDGLLYILFHSDGHANSTGYSNAKVDAWLEEARATGDQKVREGLYSNIQKQLIEDIPNVPLFFAVEYGATRSNVHGFEWIADQIPRYRELWKSK